MAKKRNEKADANGKRDYTTIDGVIQRLKDIREVIGNANVRVKIPGIEKSPLICGIRPTGLKEAEKHHFSVDIVPRFDIQGASNLFSSRNRITREIANVQLLFIQYAKSMMKVKEILESIHKRGGKVTAVKDDFNRLYEIAKQIKSSVNALEGFDKKMMEVIHETIKDSDYNAVFSHHLDFDLSDAGFAEMIADGIGEKTTVQRLAVYLDILRKINKEIEHRKRRITALDLRVKRDPDSQEAANARMIKNKTQSIIKTLEKRRDYIKTRYLALNRSIQDNIRKMNGEVEELTGSSVEL